MQTIGVHVGIAERKCVLTPVGTTTNHDVFSSVSCRFNSAGLLPVGAKTRRSYCRSIAVIPSGGRTRSSNATSDGTAFAALSATPLPFVCASGTAG